jgi:hypothetical protein
MVSVGDLSGAVVAGASFGGEAEPSNVVGFRRVDCASFAGVAEPSNMAGFRTADCGTLGAMLLVAWRE